MKIVIINSVGFWSMGWTTDVESQQDVLQSLQRADIDLEVHDVDCLKMLAEVLSTLDPSDCLVWPNAYQVYANKDGTDALWLADAIEERGFSIIGNNAQVLKSVLSKDKCQSLLADKNTAVPRFAAIREEDLQQLPEILKQRQLTFPLFTKPSDLSTSKGITQDCITHDLEALYKQTKELGDTYGYPVMVEDYLPGRDITVAIFMTPEKPIILPTYYDIDIYDNPGAVLDYGIRQRDWDDGKWLTVVSDPEVIKAIEAAVLPVCAALGICEFTRVDCRFDQHGSLKIFDVNGLPGLELPFSTTVWQMIVKMHDKPQIEAFDTLVALIIYCSCRRYHLPVPTRICQLAEQYIALESSTLTTLPANDAMDITVAHLDPETSNYAVAAH